MTFADRIGPFPVRFVADSAFGGLDSIYQLQQRGIPLTISISSNERPHLWALLSRSLVPNTWSAFVNQQSGVLLSLYSNEQKDGEEVVDKDGTAYRPSTGTHRLATSAFAFEAPTSPTTTSDSAQPRFVPSPVTGKTRTPDDLNKLNRDELRSIAKQEGVSVGKRKSDTIDNIVVMSTPVALSQQERVLQQIEKTRHRGKPPHHQQYRSEFNAVDLHNKQWYKNNLRIQIKHWRTKLVLSVMQQATINTTTLLHEYRHAKRCHVRLDIREALFRAAGPIKRHRRTSTKPSNTPPAKSA